MRFVRSADIFHMDAHGCTWAPKVPEGRAAHEGLAGTEPDSAKAELPCTTADRQQWAIGTVRYSHGQQG